MEFYNYYGQYNNYEEIDIGPQRFKTALKLNMSVGHELVHAIQWSSGLIMHWYNAMGSTRANVIAEKRAYQWSVKNAKALFDNVGKYKSLLNKY